MLEAVFLIGVPGAGKSTYAAEKLPNHVRISTDKFIEKWAKEKKMSYDKMFKLRINDACLAMVAELNEAVHKNKNIVIDQTNLTAESRRKKKYLIPDKYKFTAIIFPVDKAEQNRRLKARPNKFIAQDVLDNFRNQYRKPNAGEGFHKIITIKQS